MWKLGLGRAVAFLQDDQGPLQYLHLPDGCGEDRLSVGCRHGAMAEAQESIMQQVIDLIVAQGRIIGNMGVLAHGRS